MGKKKALKAEHLKNVMMRDMTQEQLKDLLFDEIGRYPKKWHKHDLKNKFVVLYVLLKELPSHSWNVNRYSQAEDCLGENNVNDDSCQYKFLFDETVDAMYDIYRIYKEDAEYAVNKFVNRDCELIRLEGCKKWEQMKLKMEEDQHGMSTSVK